MKSKSIKLAMAVIAMSFISLYGCGTTEDNADVDNSAQLVEDDSEIEPENDLTDVDGETQTDAAEVEAAENKEEESVKPKRTLEIVEFIEMDGEYAVTKNDEGVVFRVKCEDEDVEELKVGESYLLEYAPAEAEQIEENVFVVEGEDLEIAKPDDERV